MELITKELQEAFKKQGYVGDKSFKDIPVICKLFNPMGAGTWWLYEHVEDDIYMAYCLLDDPTFAECGTISINEMKALRLPFGLGIERDICFEIGQKTLQEVIDEVEKG